MNSEKNKTPLQRNVLVWIALSVLVIGIAGIGIFSFIHSSTGKKLQKAIGLGGSYEEDTSLYYSVSANVFALAGNKIALASTAGFQVMSMDGTSLYSQSCTLARPAIAASPVLCAFYDIGTTYLGIVYADGSFREFPQENNILFADVNDNGYLTVVTDSKEYMGRVTVYNPQLTALFQFDSGESGYPLCARLSDDKTLTIDCVSSAGSVLHYFALNSETVLGTYSAQNTLIFDFDYLDDGTVAAISDNSLVLIPSPDSASAVYVFGNSILADYYLSGSFATVLLHDSHTGNSGEMINIDSAGNILGQLSLDREVSGFSSFGDELLVQYSNELTLYSSDMKDDVSYQHIDNVLRSVLTENEQAVLFGRYSADTFQFK